ncbi:HinT-interacting membrane complex protein P80 [Mycoplasmopsis bovis]|uniref:HinT-interacting membrane complex protein P80 n=1 Tax=Mycoplasmopsis bovis TaxID=28903 RepID=UPI003D005AD5
MGKKKTPFFERLLQKNAEQENKNKTTGKSKKSRSWKIATTSTVLVLAVATGITVPLVINSTKKNFIDGYASNTNVASAKIGDHNLYLNFGDFKNIYQNHNTSTSEERLKEIDKIILYYLYDQEQKASAEYQKLWNDSKRSDEKDNNSFRLPTLDELKTKFKNELVDIENNMKLQFGTANWQTEFNKHLVQKYNGAKNIDEAVKNKTFEHIKTDALRRFRLTNGDSKKDEIERKGKDGKHVFGWWHKDNNENKFIELEDKSKLALATDSFVFKDSYKSIDPFIDSYIANEKPRIISEFTIPGIAPAKKNEKWKIDKNIFLRYLFYAKQDTFGLKKVTKGYNVVKEKFNSFDHYIKSVVSKTNGNNIPPDEAIQYSSILNMFSTSKEDIKKNWGTSGLTSISELVTGDNFQKFLANNTKLLFGDNYTDSNSGSNSQKPKEINLFNEIEKIKVEIDKFVNKNGNGVDSSSSGGSSGNGNETVLNNEQAAEYNTKLEKFFTEVNESQNKGLTEKVFEENILKKFAEIFETSGKIQTVYNVKFDNNGSNGAKNVKGILSPEGFKLLIFGNEIKKDDLVKMIKNDFILNSKYKKQLGVRYNALQKLNKQLSRNEYILKMLQDNVFKKYLKTQNNNFATDQNGKKLENVKYNEQSINDLITSSTVAIQFDKISNFIKLSKAAAAWIETRAKNSYDELFELKDGKAYFKYNKDKTAASLVLEYLKKEFNLEAK